MNLIITGNPGVGKHTIADEMMKTGDYDLFDINKIAFESKNIEKDESSVEVDVENLKNHLKNKLSKKSLIVGHLAPYVVNKSDIDLVIVLRKNPYKLAETYELRRYSKEKIKENLGSEILGIITHDSLLEFGSEKTFQVDVTSKTPNQVLEKIQTIIKEQNHNDEIDWLSEIESNLLNLRKDTMEEHFSHIQTLSLLIICSICILFLI